MRSGSGRSFGSLWGLVALKTLEHANVAALGHPSTSADALELVVRTAREALAEPWIFDYRVIDQQALVRPKLTSESTRAIFRRVMAKAPPAAAPYRARAAIRSSWSTADGNAVTGTNTHESLAWGSGTFVSRA